RMRLDGHAILRAQRAEIERGHDGGERGRGGLMPADLHAIDVLAQVVGVVDGPARKPQHLLLELAQDRELVRARLGVGAFGHRHSMSRALPRSEMSSSPSLLSCPRRRAWSNPLAGEIFSLTRVTRIFQKNVFTKTAPAGPAGAVAGFLLRARERGRCGFRLGMGRGTTWGFRPEACPRSARSCAAIGGCRNGSPSLLPCFRPVIYREPFNFAVSPH